MKENTLKNIETLFDLEPSAIIALYEIDLKEKGQYLFHAGENGYKKKLVFNNREYDFFPLKAEGFELHGDGRLPRPKLTMSNHRGVISLRLNYFEDFINYRVKRLKTFVKYLDNINFPNGKNPHAEPDPEASFTEDIFFINQKVKEDDNIVEFELVSILELENANIPGRRVYSDNCGWRYRSSAGCGYIGKPMASIKNMRFVPSGYHGPGIGEDVYFKDGEFASKEFAPFVEGEGYGIWNPLSTYNQGDVVELVPYDRSSETDPVGIYVCMENNTKSNPVYDRANWVLDECDRTTHGCRLRFADIATGVGGGKRTLTYGKSRDAFWSESEEGLPFGGFPGVDPYEYTV